MSEPTLDNGEEVVAEMGKATLTTIADFRVQGTDLTISIDRSELEDVMIGSAALTHEVAAGKAKFDGNPDVLRPLASTMTSFDNWFEVLSGTKWETASLRTPELLQDDAT